MNFHKPESNAMMGSLQLGWLETLFNISPYLSSLQHFDTLISVAVDSQHSNSVHTLHPPVYCPYKSIIMGTEV